MRWTKLGWVACALVTLLATSLRAHAESARSQDDLKAIAEDAYVYGYPLVLMDVTRQVTTNVAAPTNDKAPANQLARVDKLPTPNDRLVVMPNRDTLYTQAFLDLSKGPMVLHVPDTHGRYFLMPMLDAYSNVFASPGKRTTGTQAQDLAIVGPTWNGTLPNGVTRIVAPTNMVWLLGRTEIRGQADLPNVIALTDEVRLAPLSAFGATYRPPRGPVDPRLDMTTPPPRILAAMSGREYFTRLAKLLKEQPPPTRDRAALARFAEIGLTPGSFAPSPAVATIIESTGARATERIQQNLSRLGKNQNGWIVTTGTGSYGTRYLDRATVALVGLGANLPADAIYPVARLDATGMPLNGGSNYRLHFAKGQEPPVNAFWSITMYDSEGYLVINSADRYAIGDRDKLVRNADGSLDLLIQHDKPEGRLEANWLPAPNGPFQLTMRLYWPQQRVLDGKWSPPPIKKAGAMATVPRPKI
ncbi:MAG TPA: DUF1254 domain-containing protein [Polyangia bacterium]|nr:DUF1254 domain-containing protein [Polyangia bacterium]